MKTELNPQFDGAAFEPETFTNHIEELTVEEAATPDNVLSANLKIVLDTRAKLRELKAGEIRFADPILKQNNNAVIFPHTINVIQGQA